MLCAGMGVKASMFFGIVRRWKESWVRLSDMEFGVIAWSEGSGSTPPGMNGEGENSSSGVV